MRKILMIVLVLIIFIIPINASNIIEYGVYHEAQSVLAENRYDWVNVTHNANIDWSVDYKWTDMSGGYVWFWNKGYIFVNVGAGETVEGKVIYWSNIGDIKYTHESSTFHDLTNNDYISISRKRHSSESWIYYIQGHTVHFYPPTEIIYSISGTTACINNVTLQIYDGSDYYTMNYTELNSIGDTYSFNIVNNTQYKLFFSDGYEYEFTCTGNHEYNHDTCSYQTINFVDDCGNMLKNPYISIIKNDDWVDWLVGGSTDNPQQFLIGTDVELNDKLDIWIDTDQGAQKRLIYVELGEDTLYHSTKSWNLNVKVYDINTSGYVDDAKVSVSQSCRINDYEHNTYGTTNLFGLVKTFDLSNQDYQVKVEKEGYNTFGWQTISANFDAQCTDYNLRVNLQDSTKGSGNGTVGDPDNPDDDDGTGGDDDEPLPQTPCSIGWFNNDQKPISEINDTQDARLYFMAANCSTELMIDSRDTENHVWVSESTLPLTPKQTGYVQLTPANWTYLETKRYRGRIHSLACGCDATDDLKVWDAADPNTTIITNLSCNVHFRYASGSYINPATPIQILSKAESNNTSLLNINLQLFNGSVKVDEISYTFFDYYVDGDFDPILWNPNYEYASGYRYCVYMYSNDILVDFDTVFANATDGNPFDTGNTLCVHVFDQNSMPLSNAYVYVEGWDTKPTGTDNKVSFSGMPTDTYNYRATKPKYQDRGLSSILVDTDKVVNYVLDKVSDVHSVSAARLSNREIKRIYLPLMYLLFIMIMLGGLQYVSK